MEIIVTSPKLDATLPVSVNPHPAVRGWANA